MTDYISELISRYPSLTACEKDIRSAYDILRECYENGGKLLAAGNGGSAADADHITGELLKGFVKRRRPTKAFAAKLSEIDAEAGAYLADRLQGSLPAIALGNQTALITATLNDIDGNTVYAQQVNGCGNTGDVLFGISTSGSARDVILAMVVAKAKGLKTIALSGKTGGKMAKLADAAIVVPENETYKIQELHLPIYHALCLQIEDYFFDE